MLASAVISALEKMGRTAALSANEADQPAGVNESRLTRAISGQIQNRRAAIHHHSAQHSLKTALRPLTERHG
jgi:hypothetical protein